MTNERHKARSRDALPATSHCDTYFMRSNGRVYTLYGVVYDADVVFSLLILLLALLQTPHSYSIIIIIIIKVRSRTSCVSQNFTIRRTLQTNYETCSLSQSVAICYWPIKLIINNDDYSMYPDLLTIKFSEIK